MSRFLTAKKQFLTLILVFSGLICLFSLISDASETGKIDSIKQTDKQIKKAVELFNGFLYRDAEQILLDITKNDLQGEERAFFLLGRIYKEEGVFEDAENYLIKASDNYPLLRDYALKYLADVYTASGQFDKVIATVKKIKNRLLLQDIKKSGIEALLALKREAEAKQALFRYIKKFPEDWDYKFNFAMRLKNNGEVKQAVSIFKDIYITAAPLSEDALKELVILKADTLSKEEILKRADNLFVNNDFKKAEAAYKEVLDHIDKSEKGRVKFRIGMCRFRQKKYNESAESFGLLGTPKAMYWQARSFYRINDMKSFNGIKNKFERRYPDNKRLALLFLMEADELRRKGELRDAAKSYKKVVKRFLKKAEEALWGLGWMNYMSGDYKTALTYFSELTAYVKSRDYYKYLYWKARTKEKLFEDCIRHTESGKSENNKDVCNKIKKDSFSGLPADESYYGYLIKLRSSAHKLPDRVQVSKPARPEGKTYERIEALALLGMKDEAVNEIVDSLKRAKKRGEFLYLGYMAIGLEEYKDVIAFAEEKEDREFLPYSYPLGFRDIVNQAADSENLDAHLIAALIREESRYDPEVISWAGAIGLMQLMPSTANMLKDDIDMEIKDSSELQDARKNILLGTHYFSQLVGNFKDIPLAIAAYNAGENTLKNWMSRFNNHDITEFIENIPYKETRRYVKKVLKSYWQYRAINGLPVSEIRGPGPVAGRLATGP